MHGESMNLLSRFMWQRNSPPQPRTYVCTLQRAGGYSHEEAAVVSRCARVSVVRLQNIYVPRSATDERLATGMMLQRHQHSCRRIVMCTGVVDQRDCKKALGGAYSRTRLVATFVLHDNNEHGRLMRTAVSLSNYDVSSWPQR